MAHCWTASAAALYWAGALLDGARHAQAPEGIPDKVCCETGKMVTRVLWSTQLLCHQQWSGMSRPQCFIQQLRQHDLVAA